MPLSASAPANWPAAARPSLLVVDDELPVLRLVDRLANKAGFDVMTCSSGSDAMRLLLRKPADLGLPQRRVQL